MYCNGDYTIRIVDDLPDAADEMVMESPDGMGNIYIRGSLTFEEQREVCRHAIGHLALGHLHRHGSVDDFEKEADLWGDVR